MERKKGAREASPTEEETTGAQHAEQTPAPPGTEEARPSVVPSTLSVQTPAIGTLQTPSIPLDLVVKLLASISPGFSLTHTLTRLAAKKTKVVGSGDEKNMVEKPCQEEEVDQVIEGEELDIILLEDDDIDSGDKHEESVDQRTTRRKTRMARRIAEILATGKDRQMGGEPSEAEEEEEEEIPLIRRPRSTRVTVTEETHIPATKEDDPAPVNEAEDAEEEPVDEGKCKRERKRKGKLPERPVKKRSRQATLNVVIKEPIQVPYKQADEMGGRSRRHDQ